MKPMLNKVCRHIRNYFPEVESHEGHFEIENHIISLSFCSVGDYILIEGSKHNDGIMKYTGVADDYLIDEEFDGRISVRAIPVDFTELVAEIDVYMAKNSQIDGLTSESFGGYSYSKAGNGRGGVADWPDVFRARLNEWRKI